MKCEGVHWILSHQNAMSQLGKAAAAGSSKKRIHMLTPTHFATITRLFLTSLLHPHLLIPSSLLLSLQHLSSWYILRAIDSIIRLVEYSTPHRRA